MQLEVSPKHNHWSDIAHHMRLVRYALRSLDQQYARYRNAQRRLNTFLQMYYHRVLPVIPDMPVGRGMLWPENLTVDHSTDPYQQKLKQLFRALVWRLHPDSQKYSSLVMAPSIGEVRSLYNAGELGALWEMHIKVMEQDFSARMRRAHLKQQLDEIAQMVHRIKQIQMAQEHSSGWELMCRAEMARNQGVDLVGKIRRHMRDKYAATQHIWPKTLGYHQNSMTSGQILTLS